MPALEVLRIDVADLVDGEVFVLVGEVIGSALKKRSDSVLSEIFFVVSKGVDELIVLSLA